jgi:alkenylglycerophosphocholine/alkenylglycerophosphoethanolamine hydrolase
MALPVFVYIVVITVMGVLAVLRAMGGKQLLLGGLAFMLCDSLLAIDKFRFPVPAARYLVIITYYFAQYMIAHAFLQNE